MNRHHIPDHALQRLSEHEQRVEHLTLQLAKTQDGIASARGRLSGGFERDSDYDDMSASLNQLVADKPVIESSLRNAKNTLQSTKAFLAALPDGTVLEPVEIKTNGADLPTLQQRIAAAQAELNALRAVPTPSADIENRVRSYVEAMACPTITNISSSGEPLRVVWPGAGWDSGGPRTDRADNLAMTALVHGDALIAALMAEAERVSSTPLPVGDRKKRIAV